MRINFAKHWGKDIVPTVTNWELKEYAAITQQDKQIHLENGT